MVSSGHICQFDDMQVVSVLLDEIMKDPEKPTKDLVLQLDIKVTASPKPPHQLTFSTCPPVTEGHSRLAGEGGATRCPTVCGGQPSPPSLVRGSPAWWWVWPHLEAVPVGSCSGTRHWTNWSWRWQRERLSSPRTTKAYILSKGLRSWT